MIHGAVAVVKIKHVVKKFRHVLIKEEGECFCLVEAAIRVYLLIVRICCSRFLEVQIVIFK
jgi:hypothetical protein